jgi:hypothetical protein
MCSRQMIQRTLGKWQRNELYIGESDSYDNQNYYRQ